MNHGTFVIVCHQCLFFYRCKFYFCSLILFLKQGFPKADIPTSDPEEVYINPYDIVSELEHLLHAHPTAQSLEKQIDWESLIDWQAVNESIKITEAMAHDAEDIFAEQAAGPDRAYQNIGDTDLEWPEEDYAPYNM